MSSTDDLVQHGGALVRRRVFSDPEIYDRELESVFGRSWCFLAHDSQLPRPGDFLTTFIGIDPILVTRQDDDSVRAFLNACSHRGTMICTAEEGSARSFTCPYHGWSFGSNGNLLDVPRSGPDGYHDTLDRAAMSLKSIRVESYKGLYFGTFAEDAPSLLEYLGDFAWYLDTIFDPLPTGVEFIGGTMRIRLACNWKVASENIFADTYHVMSAHGASVRICVGDTPMEIGIEEGTAPEAGVDDLSATLNGHGWNASFDGHGSYALFREPEKWFQYVDRQRPRYIERLGQERAQFIGSSINGGVFPNFMFVPGFTFRQIHPKGPNECEIWMWTVVEKELPDELKKEMMRFNARMLGTSGMFETGDCANMERIGMTVRAPRNAQEISHYAMGEGREKPHPVFPGLIDQRVSDNCFRGYYRQWAAMMKSSSWSEIALEPTRPEFGSSDVRG